MLNTFDQQRSSDERRAQRDRHISIMNSISVGNTLDSINENPSSSSRGDDPPSGAIEKAKIFLWEEDEEDEEPEPKHELPAMSSSRNIPMFSGPGGEKTFNLSAILAANPPAEPKQSTKRSARSDGSPSFRQRITQFVTRKKKPKEDKPVNLAPRRQSKDSLHFDDLDLDDLSYCSSDEPTVSKLQMCKITMAECGDAVYKRRKTIAVLTAIACIIGACVAVIIPQVAKQDPAPESVSDMARYMDIKSRIVDEGISSEFAINRKGTPQHEALLWISEVDGAELDIEDDMLIQRYSLAVFFFTTYVEAEVEDEEEEKMQLSDYSSSISMAKSAKTIKPEGWKNSTNWMSKKGYCSWAGVGCHHKPGTDLEKIHYDGNYGVTHLNLTSNNIRGKIPDEIVALTDLRLLNLGDNEMKGEIPENIGDLKNLVTVHLGANDLNGPIPTSLGKLDELTHLYLYSNQLNGKIPDELSGAKELRVLSLYGNKLGNDIPDLANLTHLTDLYLDDNRLRGNIPSEFGVLTKLKDLRLSMNTLKGSIPEELGNLENLESLYLDRNHLTGSLPSSLSQLDHLEKFHAYENNFKGHLPYQWGSLENLQILYLDNNALTGGIPHSWGGSKSRVGMQDLQQLYLHKNKISGNIPTQMGALEDMRNLQLHDNQLDGSIPSEMGKMFKLKFVYMENNKLTGEIPTEMSRLTHLERLRINGNEIVGEVPEDVCDLSKSSGGKLVEFHMDCDGETPEVECDCCTSCF